MNVYVSDINIDITKPLSEFKIDEFVIGAIVFSKITNRKGYIDSVALTVTKTLLIGITWDNGDMITYQHYELKNIFCNGLLIDIHLD